MFSQILKLIPRTEFERIVKETKAEYRSKGLSSWAQFVGMMFCQLGRAHSLREIEGGLLSCEGKLAHLGIEAPKRSSLSYANAHRPPELFEKVFHALHAKVASTFTGKRKFRFKNKLMSLDSTSIELCLSMYDWAKFTRTKGAVKLHLVLDHDGYLPKFAVITDGKVHDVTVAQQLSFEAGTIVVDDRGYTDYQLYGDWTAAGVFFVSRLRSNANYKVLERREIAQTHTHILRDEVIELNPEYGYKKCPYPLRRVVVRGEDGEALEFVTNHLRLAASSISDIYKDRWQIELFFKAIKQNLKIKTFVGTSSNAVKTQIWTALMAMLLLRYLQMRSQFGWSLSNLVALLRLNLFTHRDLMAWINQPYAPSPDPDTHPQMALVFA
jgi:hypothetical protein